MSPSTPPPCEVTMMNRLLFICPEISYANERMYIVSLKQSPMESHCMDRSATYIFTLYSTLENFPHLCKDQHWSLKWPYSISLCGWIIIFLTCSLMTNMYTVSWLLPLPKMLPAASSFTYLCARLQV